MEVNHPHRLSGGIDGGVHTAQGACRAGEYRDSAGFCDRLHRRADHAQNPSRRQSPVPMPLGAGGSDFGSSLVHSADVLAALRELAEAGRVVGDRALHLCILRQAAQHHAPASSWEKAGALGFGSEASEELHNPAMSVVRKAAGDGDDRRSSGGRNLKFIDFGPEKRYNIVTISNRKFQIVPPLAGSHPQAGQIEFPVQFEI